MISAPFIRRPIATSLVMAGVLLLGLAAYRQLGIASLPAVDLPTIYAWATLPGASPETIATALAQPLERELGRIAGVSELTSLSTADLTVLTIQFELGHDIDAAARDVQAALNAAAPALPKDLPRPPVYRKSNPAQAPLIVLALTCDTLPSGRVFDYADTVIAQKLAQIEGVSEVSVSGAEKSAVRVRIDPGALAATGLGLEDVRAAIQKATVNGPKGAIEGPHQAYAVAADDQLFDAAAYRGVIVAYRNGAPVRLGDLGSVVEGVANTRAGGWLNLKRAVIVTVRRQPGANIVEAAERVRAALPQLERWIPPAVKIEVLTDRTPRIRASVADVQGSLLIAVGLVVLSIFVFLRRVVATLIPCVAIPVSLAGTFAIMYLCGFTLDNLSLMALTVATGFVVDDAIVMIENIARCREQGMTPLAAALAGARQITFTIMSITVSLLAAFLPLFLMPGIVGMFFVEFSVTLSAAVIVSAIVSLTLTPMLCARFLGREGERPPGRVSRAAGRALDRAIALYRASLELCLRHRLFVLLATLFIVFATVRLYAIVPKGFVPPQDTGIITATTEAPQDISFAAMQEAQGRVVAAILADPAVEKVGSFIGPGGVGGLSNGRLFIYLRPAEEGRPGRRATTRPMTRAVIDRLRPVLARIAGISTYLVPVQDFGYGGREGKGQYQYTLRDEDAEELRHWLPLVLARVKQLPELRDVGTDQQARGLAARLRVDRDTASRLGVSMQALDETLYDAFGQRQVATIYTPLDQFHVVLEIEPRDGNTLDALERVHVRGKDGAQVPLSALVRVEPDTAALSIAHQGQFPAVTISFNLATGVALSQGTAAIEAAFDAVNPPGTLRASFEGNARAFRASSSAQPVLIFAAIAVVYIVLGILYESYVHPLTILSTLPSAGLGALLAMLMTGTELTLVALIGLILLIGIVKKNAIMMIDFALEAERSRGLTPERAIVEAAVLRFRPIMMTTLAALLGALPLALGAGSGSELRAPLGITITGGLALSQALTLYSTPVVYLYLDRLRRRRGPLPALAAVES